MPKRSPEEHLRPIEDVVRPYPGGRTAQQIREALAAPPLRTLQYRLKFLVECQRLVMEGSGRWARYRGPTRVLVPGQATRADVTKALRDSKSGRPCRSPPPRFVNMSVSRWQLDDRPVTTGPFWIRIGPITFSISHRKSVNTCTKLGARKFLSSPPAPTPGRL